MPASKPKVERICKQCGKVQLVSPSQVKRPFCSRECMGEWRSENLSGKNNANYKGGKEVPCSQCGKPVYRQPCYLDLKQHFCSKECQGAWNKGNLVGEANPNWRGGKAASQERGKRSTKNKVPVACSHCSKTLYRTKHELRRSKHFFCNLTCHGLWDSTHKVGEDAGNWRGGPATDPCTVCGKPVVRPKAHSKRTEYAFCSPECYRHWLSRRFSGENNPNYQGGIQVPNYGYNWDRQKRRVLDRDDHTCQRCGKTKDDLGQEPDVHHIVPFTTFLLKHELDTDMAAREGNTLTNLISLCRPCHLKIEPRRNPHAISYDSLKEYDKTSCVKLPAAASASTSSCHTP